MRSLNTSQNLTTIPASSANSARFLLAKRVSSPEKEMYSVRTATVWNLGKYVRNVVSPFRQPVGKELSIAESTIIGKEIKDYDF